MKEIKSLLRLDDLLGGCGRQDTQVSSSGDSGARVWMWIRRSGLHREG